MLYSNSLRNLNALSNLRLRSTEDDLYSLKDAVSETQAFLCGQFAVLALLVYDIIITMDYEINFFWTASFNPTKVAFLLVRWTAVFGTSLSILSLSLGVSSLMCNFASWGLNLSNCLIFICIDYALYLRIRALYSLDRKDKKIASYVLIMFVIEAAVILGINLHEIITVHVIAAQMSGFSYCGLITTPSEVESYLCWAVILSYQLMIASLSVFKAARLRRTLGPRGVTLVKVIVQNQLIYVAIILAYGIFNLLWLYVDDGSAPLIVAVLFHIIGSSGTLSLVGSRMLIQLRQTSEQNPGEGGSLRLPTHASTNVFRAISTRSESASGHSQEFSHHSYGNSNESQESF